MLVMALPSIAPLTLFLLHHQYQFSCSALKRRYTQSVFKFSFNTLRFEVAFMYENGRIVCNLGLTNITTNTVGFRVWCSATHRYMVKPPSIQGLP